MSTPYDTLGVEPTATKSDIKKAYRRRAQKAHPDKGGNANEFNNLAKAYALLSDDTARKKFDETGDASGAPDNLFTELAHILCAVVDSVPDAATSDVIALMHREITGRQTAISKQMKTLKGQLAKLQTATNRIKVREGSVNVLRSLLESVAAGVEKGIEGLRHQDAHLSKLREKLSVYSYTVDAEIPSGWAQMISTSTSRIYR